MSKRFIDTDIFKKIKTIEGPYKLLYIYMFCECDHAGIWQVELDIAAIRLGFEYDEIKALGALGNKVKMVREGHWYITDFVEFQYGKLNPDNRVHVSVMNILTKYKIKPLTSPSQRRKDKDKDKDMVLDKDILEYYKKRIGALKGRRESTVWSSKEMELLRKIGVIEEEDMKLMEIYYAADIKEDDYRRTTIAILLNNWTGEVDRARNFKPEISHHDKFKEDIPF